MTFRIYGIDKDGNEDMLVIHGESIEEIKAKALEETDKRGWSDMWSEQTN